MLDWTELLVGRWRRMSSVDRHTTLPVVRRENVAEHTWYVCLYAYALAQDCKRDIPDLSQGFAVDIGAVLTKALFHDVDETMTGDVLRTLKHHDPAFRDSLNRFAGMALAELDRSGLEVSVEWERSKDKSLEGQIVAMADLLAMVAFLIDEARFGNRHVLGVAVQVRSTLEAVRDRRYPKVTNIRLIVHAREVLDVLDRVMMRLSPSWPACTDEPDLRDPFFQRYIAHMKGETQ